MKEGKTQVERGEREGEKEGVGKGRRGSGTDGRGQKRKMGADLKSVSKATLLARQDRGSKTQRDDTDLIYPHTCFDLALRCSRANNRNVTGPLLQ